MGMATNIVAVQPTLPSVSNLQVTVATVIQISTLILFFALMLFIQVSVGMSRNLKPRKLILRAFLDFPPKLAPTKITCHMVLRGRILDIQIILTPHHTMSLKSEASPP